MKQHTVAVEAATKSVAAVADKTFVTIAMRDANGKLPQAPYVVIHPADGTDSQARYAGPRVAQHPRFVFNIVGTSYDNVSELAARIKEQFVVDGRGVVLFIPGEVCKPCEWSSPLPVQVNDELTPPLIYAVAELSFDTDPA